MRRVRCSPAMGVALLALYVATGGGAFAAGKAMIPGALIKPHSLPLSALTPRAVAALRGRQGPAGARGGIDPANVSVVVSPTVDVAAGAIAGAIARCPANSVALGGGGNTGGGKLVSLVPVVDAVGSTQAVGWEALADNDTALPVTAEAFVICASP